MSKSLHLIDEYSEREMDLFSSLVRAGDTVLDVGANLGGLTLGFAGLVGATGRVHDFDLHA